MIGKIILIFLIFKFSNADVYDAPQTLPNRQTMVHLFEWKWPDIANECETFLGKYGYGAVQISPPNEHLMQDTTGPHGEDNVPWWIRYQPVSYSLSKSRSGTIDEFIDMVQRCNNVGVRIIVDGVINHMVKVNQKYPGQYGIWSSAGSQFDGTDNIEQFPGVPYSNLDFNDPYCHNDIQGYDYSHNPDRVRRCRLADCDTCDGLLDLNHGKDYVRGKISDYFNHVVNIGVAGVRIDAAKHMYPDDIKAILDLTSNLNQTIFGANQRPFIVQEVIDKGGEAIKADEYVMNGRVTNFKYGMDLSGAVRHQQNFKYLYNFGPGWAYWSDVQSLVFVDNHDNQRDPDDQRPLTYKDGQQYVMAVTYMLAWTYGYPRVMSSYYFDYRDQGPPNSGSPNWITNSPTFDQNEQCNPSSGFVCEHRWPQVRRMTTFRSVVGDAAAADVVHDEDNRLAFRRGDQGFFALNNQNGDWNRKFYVGVPQGSYCDVISGEFNEKINKCTGTQIDVDENGEAQIRVPAGFTVAIHVGQKIPGPPPPPPTSLPTTFQRIVIMVHKQTDFGQNLFIRGGLDQASHGCQDTHAGGQCSVPIVHQTNVTEDFISYTWWSEEDQFLDWFGGEDHQGTFDGIPAQGTPLTWTTNNSQGLGYNPLNTYGDAYWLIDAMMDCSKTDNGWFSFKGYFLPTINGAGTWENDVHQIAQCRGNAGVPTPNNVGSNHAGMCGYFNVFDYDSQDCEIKTFS